MAIPDSNRFCVSNLTSPRTVQLHLTGQHRDTVLIELVNALPELAQRPEGRQALLRALQERETLHSTGVGDGIALPHARTTLSGLVEQPAIVIGRHPVGIPFDAVDDQPVRLFFLLVTTAITQHLQILGRLTRLLRNPSLRQNLLAAGHPDQVIHLIHRAEADL